MSPSTGWRTKPGRLLIASLLLLSGSAGGASQRASDPARQADAAQEKAVYRAKLAVPDVTEPFLKHVEPGSDAFPLEAQVKELEARLRELSGALRSGGGARTPAIVKTMLDPGFRGARLLPAQEPATSQAQLEVTRAKDPAQPSRL